MNSLEWVIGVNWFCFGFYDMALSCDGEHSYKLPIKTHFFKVKFSCEFIGSQELTLFGWVCNFLYR